MKIGSRIKQGPTNNHLRYYPTVPGVEIFFWDGLVTNYRDPDQVKREIGRTSYHSKAIANMGGRIGYYRINHNKQTSSYLGCVFTDALQNLINRWPSELETSYLLKLDSDQGAIECLFQTLGAQALRSDGMESAPSLPRGMDPYSQKSYD